MDPKTYHCELPRALKTSGWQGPGEGPAHERDTSATQLAPPTLIRKVAIQTKTVRINKNVKGRRKFHPSQHRNHLIRLNAFSRDLDPEQKI